MLTFSGAALLAWCLSAPAAAGHRGDSQATAELGGVELPVFVHRPSGCSPAAILLVFHGLRRDAESYRKRLRPLADELCLLEVAPLFDQARFPSWRYQKGGIVHRGAVQPSSAWTGNLVVRLAEWVRRGEGRPDLPYVAVGHSAGAQFLSRFAAFVPNDARAIVIANPSTHVLASLEEDAPFGFRGAFASGRAETALRDYLARPVVVILGEDDEGDKDRDDEPAALRQGTTRYERGLNAFRAARAEAADRGWPFGWRLIELRGVGHSASAVFRAAPVEAAIRDALGTALPSR